VKERKKERKKECLRGNLKHQTNKQKTLICCFVCLSIPSSFVFLF